MGLFDFNPFDPLNRDNLTNFVPPKKDKKDERPLAKVYLTDFGNLQLLVSICNESTREIRIHKDPTVDTLAKIVNDFRIDPADEFTMIITEEYRQSKERMKKAFEIACVREIRDKLQKEIDSGKMVRIKDGKKYFFAIKERIGKNEYFPSEFMIIVNDVFKNLNADQCFVKKEEERK